MSEDTEYVPEYKYTLERETHRLWRIVNNKSGKVYRVWRNDTDNKYTCTCPYFGFRANKACKHISMILKQEGKI